MLLKMSMGGLRIDNHWGSGGGQRPVIQLIKEVIDLDQTGEDAVRKLIMCFLYCLKTNYDIYIFKSIDGQRKNIS